MHGLYLKLSPKIANSLKPIPVQSLRWYHILANSGFRYSPADYPIIYNVFTEK